MAKSIPKWNGDGTANPVYRVPRATPKPVGLVPRKTASSNSDISADTSTSISKPAIESKFTFPKASIPSGKLDFNSHDDEIAGKTWSDKWNTVADNAAKSKLGQLLVNSAPNKIMQRAADSFVGQLDKAAGVDPASHESFNPETNVVESAVGDIIGFGAGMSTRLPGLGGGSVQGALTPVGNAAEKLVTKGLSKVNLAGAAGKAANFILPTAARDAAEGALYGGAIGLSSGDGLKGTAEEVGKGALENMTFGMGLKGLGSATHKLGEMKVKISGVKDGRVNYTDAEGNQKSMILSIFKRAAEPVINTPVSSSEPILAGLDNAGATASKASKDLTGPVSAKYTVVNTELRKAQQEYENAIEAIHNHFGHYKLEPDEIQRIQPELGINLDEIVGRLENARTEASRIGADVNLAEAAGVKDLKQMNLINPVKRNAAVSSLEPFLAGADSGRATAQANPGTLGTNAIAATEQAAGVTHPAMGANDRTLSLQDVIIGGSKEKTPLLQGIKDKASDIYTHLVDINNPIKKVDETTYRLATNSKKVGGTIDAIFNENLVDMEGRPIGESLKSIAEDMPQDEEGKREFLKYVLQRHNIDRAREGKHVFTDFSSEESAKAAQLIELQHPEWKALNDRLTGFVNKFMDTWGHKSGMIEDDLWQSLNDTYKNYIPTQREYSALEEGVKNLGGKGFVDQSNPLKKATGSERNIIDPMENIMNLVNRTVRTARYNEVGQNLVKALEADPEGLRKFAEIIPETELVPNPKYKKEMNLKKFAPGMDAEGSGLTPFKSQVKNTEPEFIERPVEINANDKSIVSVLVNGKPVNVKVNDENLLESLHSVFKNPNLNDWEKNIAKPLTNAFKALITTKNPLFTVSNVMRDIPTAYVNGSEKNPFKFAADYASALNDIRKNTDIAKQYRAVGGEMSNFFSPDKAAEAVKDLTKRDNILVKGLKKVEAVNNATETIPRLAEFKRTLEKGGTVQDALYNAGEVTTNFSRGGDITKRVDISVPYLNASVQGLDRTMRQFKNAPIQTVLKGATIVTAPTLILDAVNANNPNYKELDNRTKDTYFLIPTGDTFIKIPKSREIGVLFSSLTERAIRAASGEEQAFKGFSNTVANNFTPVNPFTSGLWAPLVRNLPMNKDFAGRAIVPLSMQDRSPAQQYDETTSEIGKAIGQAANISPKQVDYLIRSYFGIVAQLALPAATKSNYEGSGRTGNLLKPVTNKFTADPVYSNQSMTDFYDNVDMLKQIAADSNFINGGNDKKVTTGAEAYRNSFNSTLNDISDLSKKATEADTPEEARSIRQQMIDLVKQANATLPTADKKKLEKILSSMPAKSSSSSSSSSSTRSTSTRDSTLTRGASSKRN